MRLHELDSRLVPRFAAVVQRAAGRLPAGVRRSGPLRRLDDRYVRRGALGLVGDVPQLGLLVCAALVAAGGAVVMQRERARVESQSAPAASSPATRAARPSRQAPARPAAGGATLDVGPELGNAVPAYIQAAHEVLAERAGQNPADEGYAVVSFVRSQAAAELPGVLGEARPLSVFLRVPPPPPQPQLLEHDVTDLGSGLRSAFEGAARELADQAAGSRQMAADLAAAGIEAAQRREYERSAREFNAQAQRMAAGCACVVAVVVRAPLDLLQELTRRPDVRLVDVAPAGAVPDLLRFRPLLPEERQTVTAGNEAVRPDSND